MSSEIHAYNISVIKPVGEISEKKVASIKALGYDLAGFVPGTMAQFVQPATSSGLALGQNQITLFAIGATGLPAFSEPTEAIRILRQIMDTLLLDNQVVLEFKIEQSYPAAGNVFEKANALAAADLLFEGSTSIGFRIPYKKDGFQGEVSIEPFFANPQRYYINYRGASEPQQTEDGAITSLSNMMHFFEAEIQPLAHKLFIER